MPSIFDQFPSQAPVDVAGTPFQDQPSAVSKLLFGKPEGPDVRDPQKMAPARYIVAGGKTHDPAQDAAWDDATASPNAKRVREIMGSEPMKRLMDLAMFLGPGAKTANLGALSKAQAAAAKGVPREQIWSEHGWFAGPDKKWRFEIGDKYDILPGPDGELREVGAIMKTGDKSWAGPLAAGHSPSATLWQMLKHDDLFAAYPDMKGMAVRRSEGGGSGWQRGNEIGLDRKILEGLDKPTKVQDIKKGTDVTLHEAQHRVQDLEGFASGGNASMFADDAARAAVYDNAATVAMRVKSLGETPEQAAAYIAKSSGHDPAELAHLAKNYNFDELFSWSRKYNPKEQYRRLGGEVEARAVEKRIDLTPEQRRARPPWLDYDVPEAQMIIKD